MTISRKYLIFTALLGTCLSFATQSNCNARIAEPDGSGGRSPERPNLLFIMTDQQRFDAMSCAGNLVLETPNMDRIAREGVMFKNNYTANPVCVPARAVFLTGLSSVNVRVESNGDYTSEDVPIVPTFDQILKEGGYAAEYYGNGTLLINSPSGTTIK